MDIKGCDLLLSGINFKILMIYNCPVLLATNDKTPQAGFYIHGD